MDAESSVVYSGGLETFFFGLFCRRFYAHIRHFTVFTVMTTTALAQTLKRAGVRFWLWLQGVVQ